MDLQQIYNEAFQHSHGAGIQAVWDAAVAETHRIRDALASDLAGVDVESLVNENTALKAKISDLQAQVTALIPAAPVETVVQPDAPAAA